MEVYNEVNVQWHANVYNTEQIPLHKMLNMKQRDMSGLRGSAHKSKIPLRRFHWLRNQLAFFFYLRALTFWLVSIKFLLF